MSLAESSTSLPERGATRRALFGLGTATALGGCGFRPLYLPETAADRAAAAPQYEDRVVRELAAVQVAWQPERLGQLFRRALQQKLNPRGVSTPARYEVRTVVVITADPLGFRRDGTLSRVRYGGAAPWTLLTLDEPPRPLANGRARTFESYDILDNQFFASDFGRDEANARLVELMSDDIVTRLALFFRSLPAA